MSNLSPVTMLLLAGAFVAGWLASYLAPRIFNSGGADPRESRIRSLEAELRVAQSSLERSEEALEAKEQELEASVSTVNEYAKTMNDQAADIERLTTDLRESVKKTIELREDLTDRAEEGLRATVKLKSVETELSVIQAGSEMISGSGLEYDVDDDDGSNSEKTSVQKAVKFTL